MRSAGTTTVYCARVMARLAGKLAAAAGSAGYRAFTDSAPVLEKALARGEAGLDRQAHQPARPQRRILVLPRRVFTDLPLPVDAPVSAHCGNCTACIDVCPTRAIVAPWQRLDSRRCISYLTIELDGIIPEEFRAAIGNRIYGCDDCQLVCPWNRYARQTAEADFRARHGLDRASLLELFGWSEPEFLERTAGSAIRRIGYQRWQRNIAIALGNAPPSPETIAALESRKAGAAPDLREHIDWSLARLRAA